MYLNIYIAMMSNKQQKKPINSKEQMLLIANQLLNSEDSRYSNYEMEAKFGTRGYRHISKIDYDNVVKKLKSSGFTSSNGEDGLYSLKIQPETIDPRTGKVRSSFDFDKFRVEIKSITNIQEYCNTNEIKTLATSYNSVEIIKKNDVFVNDEPIRSADFNDFNFRVTYKKEDTISKTGKIGNELINNWNNSKKQFRYMNRVSFRSPTCPIIVDLSVVRSSTVTNRQLIKTYNIDESNVFNNPEIYEIEIEVDTSAAKIEYAGKAELLVKDFENVIKQVLSGLQKTNYPISYKEQDSIIGEYLKLLYEEEDKKNGKENLRTRAFTSNFIGPSSKTLQRKHIMPINPNINVPNITETHAFCVTDKADGDRHLLYVNSNGKIYLINTNMNVIFTGAKSNHEECFNSIIDGELIIHNKNGGFINTFAAFDIYYINKTDVRSYPFMKLPIKEKEKDNKIYENDVRLNLLRIFIKELNPVSIIKKQKDTKIGQLLNSSVNEKICPINITAKNFYPIFQKMDEESEKAKEKEGEGSLSIFESCNFIWEKYKDGLYPYNIDGLIFTPTLLGVGSNKIGVAGPLKKITWDYSFKWKPEEFLTIDFLVSTKKGTDGKDIISPLFEKGTNMSENSQFKQYKTLILSVGYNEGRHGYINPCQDVLDEKPNYSDEDNDKSNKPKQFYPTEPYDIQGGLCNIMIEPDANGSLQMFSKERQVFTNGTIVEFSYDKTKDGLWKWEPLRVRYDKTADFRNGNNSFGNDYSTADDNWFSIHNPVTDNMITSGKNIPDILVSTDVYYNNTNSDRATERMRDFHNTFVKKTLIDAVSSPGHTLIDFACGKAGDLPKWIASKLSFVFGIDIAKDNLENRKNGACARYLNFKKDIKKMPYALFVHGDSSKNIRSGQSMLNDKAISITKTIFGTGVPNTKLGPAVERQHNKGHDGFNISSVQFAIHYMFEKNVNFYNFMRNIAECTKLNGYFIGTCYDGKQIFNMLKQKQQGESVDIYENGQKIWQIVKDYETTTFVDEESCLGHQISVYQDSINQLLPEYLVNFEFLNKIMTEYGFILITRDEAKTIGLPDGSGMFGDLFNMMNNKIAKNNKLSIDYKTATHMTDNEKTISFLNRYFVYKKFKTINAEKLTNAFLSKLPDELEFERAETVREQKIVIDDEIDNYKKTNRKLKEKLILQNSTDSLEEEPIVIIPSNIQTNVKKSRKKKNLIIEE